MKKPVSRQPSAVSRQPFMNKTCPCCQQLSSRWQSVAWKTMMCFDVTTLDDVKADTNQTANRKSRWPCDAREKHARFSRDEIINLAWRGTKQQLYRPVNYRDFR